MTELIVAAWALSAVLLFGPLGPLTRLLRRRLRPASADSSEAEAQPLASPTSPGEEQTPPERITGAVGDQLPQPLDATQDEEVSALTTDPAGAATAPVAVADAVAEEPSRVSAQPSRRSAAAWALRLSRRAATLGLYVVFVVTSVYLIPKLLARVLDNEHPLAAITSQSMYPTLKRGDLVLMEGVDDVTDLKVDDIVAYEHEDGFAIHRIVRIEGETITTKGDANPEEDAPITFDKVIGRTLTVGGRVVKIPYLGNIPLLFGGTSEIDEGQEESRPIFAGEGGDGSGSFSPD